VLYQGGYSTYKTLKAEALAREAERAKAAEPAPVRTLGDKPAKAEKIEAAALGPKPLTYAERIELEGLLEKVASAEDTLAALEAKLADPELYTKRAADAPALREQTEKARAEVERLMARWEKLEARRDAKR
jgi:ATP-binding cassette subfamily F protein uup